VGGVAESGGTGKHLCPAAGKGDVRDIFGMSYRLLNQVFPRGTFIESCMAGHSTGICQAVAPSG
jgi:hypothetical protein